MRGAAAADTTAPPALCLRRWQAWVRTHSLSGMRRWAQLSRKPKGTLPSRICSREIFGPAQSSGVREHWWQGLCKGKPMQTLGYHASTWVGQRATGRLSRLVMLTHVRKLLPVLRFDRRDAAPAVRHRDGAKGVARVGVRREKKTQMPRSWVLFLYESRGGTAHGVRVLPGASPSRQWAG